MQIGKFFITRDHRPQLTEKDFTHIDEEYEKALASGKKLVLGVLSARSGTKWLCQIFDAHDNATGVTERYFEPESFYRYITYNKLPIDTRGIISLIKYGILQDWKRADISLVYSPFFSHGIIDLYKELKPSRFIFAVNDPEFTVQSFYNKGIGRHYYIRDHVDLAMGFQPSMYGSWSYNFGRIVPNGEMFNMWQTLTRVGRGSWYGNRITIDMYAQMQQLPPEVPYYFHLKDADQNYDYYLRLAKIFGLAPLISEKRFLSLKKKTVKAKQNTKHQWSDQERKEFELYTKEWKAIYEELLREKKYLS